MIAKFVKLALIFIAMCVYSKPELCYDGCRISVAYSRN
jgi:hypothetical protein